jgi:hypothetical protein
MTGWSFERLAPTPFVERRVLALILDTPHEESCLVYLLSDKHSEDSVGTFLFIVSELKCPPTLYWDLNCFLSAYPSAIISSYGRRLCSPSGLADSHSAIGSRISPDTSWLRLTRMQGYQSMLSVPGEPHHV